MSRLLIYSLAVIAALILVGEAVARYGLGLGTPPLSVAHPRIDYMFAPNQDVDRFGNRQLYNAYGMRNAPVSSWGDDRRVLVFGDSVLNGGNLTDHEELATTIASDDVADAVFANISAGSWGPDNILGWMKTFGLLDADAVVLVLSSHDLGDAPQFAPLNPATHPTETPVSALYEGVVRYLPRYLPDAVGEVLRPAPGKRTLEGEITERPGREALPQIFRRLAAATVPACVVVHGTRSEMQKDDPEELRTLQDLVSFYGVPTVAPFGDVSRSEVNALYRDDIHINDRGQRELADAILKCDQAATVPQMEG